MSAAADESQVADGEGDDSIDAVALDGAAEVLITHREDDSLVSALHADHFIEASLSLPISGQQLLVDVGCGVFGLSRCRSDGTLLDLELHHLGGASVIRHTYKAQVEAPGLSQHLMGHSDEVIYYRDVEDLSLVLVEDCGLAIALPKRVKLALNPQHPKAAGSHQRDIDQLQGLVCDFHIDLGIAHAFTSI